MSTPESLLDAAAIAAGPAAALAFKEGLLVLSVTDRNRSEPFSVLALRIAAALDRAGSTPATVRLWVAWSELRHDRETLAQMLAAEGGSLLP